VKKFLVILTLALALCLACGVALADQYYAVYDYSAGQTDADVLDFNNYTVTDVNGGAITLLSGTVTFDDSAVTHATPNWVVLKSDNAKDENGDPVDVNVHAYVIREAAQHVGDGNITKDEACRVYQLCKVCGCKLYQDTGANDLYVKDAGYTTAIRATVVFNHNKYEKVVYGPDCDDFGYYIQACKDCGKEFGDGYGTIEPTHKAVKIWIQAPSCLNGVEAKFFWQCSKCGGYLDFDATTFEPDTGMNNLLPARKVATLTKTTSLVSYEEYNKENGTEIDEKGHTFDAWVTTYEADCEHPKTEIRWCLTCKSEFETRYTDPALKAMFVPQTVSCISTDDVVFKCVLCGGKALNHTVNLGDLETALNATDTDPTTGAKLADLINVVHTFDYSAATKVGAAVPATCETRGKQDYKCIYEAQHTATVGTTAPSAHYNYGPKFTPALGHLWSAWEEVVAPQEQKNITGFWRRECSRCHKVDRWFEELPPASACAEHNWIKDEVNSVEPTCTEAGEIVYICSVCGTTKDTTEAVPAAGHDWDVEVIVDSTCAKEGTSIKTCKVCGKVEKGVVAKKDHTYGEWVVTKEATKEADGEETRTCTACGEAKETREVEYKITKKAAYSLEDVAFSGNIVTGKLVHDEDTLEADAKGIRVTFYNGNTYITVAAQLYADGTFEAEGAGAVEHITVAAYATEKVVNPAGLNEDNWFGSTSIDVK
jgi:hypothetical protein